MFEFLTIALLLAILVELVWHSYSTWANTKDALKWWNREWEEFKERLDEIEQVCRHRDTDDLSVS